ncbi:hypothetical protein RF11_02537 [Thelohanellus kitauei]|uniref:Uncharacterized protein n=1 Tax=Thelohanellus kitauei TaxID=669202 RepID=A0A0C2N356_THEKT|nr:hypothetical protein RF11_02537 [Thelohanellus kitauei]
MPNSLPQIDGSTVGRNENFENSQFQILFGGFFLVLLVGHSSNNIFYSDLNCQEESSVTKTPDFFNFWAWEILLIFDYLFTIRMKVLFHMLKNEFCVNFIFRKV